MSESETRQPIWWVWLNISVILFSAALVLYPPVRHLGIFILPFGLVLMPAYFVVLIRRERGATRGSAPIGGLYAQAKAGQRLRPTPLEMAAAVALLLAVAVLV